eukprot:m.152166 g.152166  ORF g.152166 m.152166 type:complete len:85 (-) comp30795_c4_seq2:2759-3013(-)
MFLLDVFIPAVLVGGVFVVLARAALLPLRLILLLLILMLLRIVVVVVGVLEVCWSQVELNSLVMMVEQMVVGGSGRGGGRGSGG